METRSHEHDIYLNSEQTELFVDEWENRRELWDHSHPLFKNKVAKYVAYRLIAEVTGIGWTPGMVKRKIESLKGYYRAHKNNRTRPTKRKVWSLLKRIESFLGQAIQKHPSEDLQLRTLKIEIDDDSNCEERSDETCRKEMSPELDMQCWGVGSTSTTQCQTVFSAVAHTGPQFQAAVPGQAVPAGQHGAAAASRTWGHGEGVTVLGQHQVIGPASQPRSGLPRRAPAPIQLPPSQPVISSVVSYSFDQKDASEEPSSADPLPKRGRLATEIQGDPSSCLRETTAAQVSSSVCGEGQTAGNPHQLYGVYVADRLLKIRSVKRLTKLKHAIDCLIHEAVMEELPD